jgi:hypothetical protein
MTVWIDAEDLFAHARQGARPSGIQRVALALGAALREAAPGAVRFVRHDIAGGTLREVAWAEVAALSDALAAPPAPRPAPAPAPRLRGALAGLPVELRQPLAEAARAQAAALRAALRAAKAAPSAVRRRLSRPPSGAELRALAQPGDVLAAFGSPWPEPRYAALVGGLRAATGLRFALLVHDVIPLTRPEFCDPALVAQFDAFLRGCLPIADRLMTVSRATAAALAGWAATQGVAMGAAPAPIPLGLGIATDRAAALPGGLAPGGYVLMVGTIEARKNHLLAFRAWRRLLAEMPRDAVPVLVFAGRIGWMVGDLLRALDNTAWLDGRIVHVDAPDDALLAALYRGCRFTLFPSHDEGWGLPVRESLAFGKACVASDRGAVPEAGGGLCLSIDPDDAAGAAAVLRRAIEDPALVPGLEARIRAEHRPVPWSATAAEVLRLLG